MLCCLVLRIGGQSPRRRLINSLQRNSTAASPPSTTTTRPRSPTRPCCCYAAARQTPLASESRTVSFLMLPTRACIDGPRRFIWMRPATLSSPPGPIVLRAEGCLPHTNPRVRFADEIRGQYIRRVSHFRGTLPFFFVIHVFLHMLIHD